MTFQRPNRLHPTQGATLADIIMLLAVSFVLVSLLLPAVARQRASARANTCKFKLLGLGLAVHNYHSAYDRLPGCGIGTNAGSPDEPLLGNGMRLSVFVGVLPFNEQQPLWERIWKPLVHDGTRFHGMGPYPTYDPNKYPPWAERPDFLVCPSDKAATKYTTASSYVVNYGDGILDVGAPLEPSATSPYGNDRSSRRGVFTYQARSHFRDILDGMSNTLMISESKIVGVRVARDVPGLPLNPSLAIEAAKNPSSKFWQEGREATWVDGVIRSTGFQTILPPNSPSATSDKGELEAVMSASSHHPGGVHVVFADGNVKFVSDTIDAGSNTSPGVSGGAGNGDSAPSPYGLWGALGTRASKEVIDGRDPSIGESPIERTPEEIQALQSLPIETWTASNGVSKLKARLINVENRTSAVFLTESNEIKNVPLTALSSEDAYRAIEQLVQRRRKMHDGLIRNLEEGVRLLETKQLETFIDKYVREGRAHPENRAEELRGIALMRGFFIALFDLAIRELESPSPNSGVQIDDSTGAVTIEARGLTSLKLKLEPVGNDWKFGR